MTLFDGLLTWIWHSMRSLGSSPKTAAQKKLLNEETYPRTLSASSTEVDHVSTRTTMNNQLVHCKPAHAGKEVSPIYTFGSLQLPHVHKTSCPKSQSFIATVMLHKQGSTSRSYIQVWCLQSTKHYSVDIASANAKDTSMQDECQRTSTETHHCTQPKLEDATDTVAEVL